MVTDKAVTISDPRGIISATGMEYDNKSKTIKLQVPCQRSDAASKAAEPYTMNSRPMRTRDRRYLACLLDSLPFWYWRWSCAPPAHAEKADRDKPINFQGDSGAGNADTKIGELAGNVVVTQGTLTIHADRIAFHQNPTIRCRRRPTATR